MKIKDRVHTKPSLANIKLITMNYHAILLQLQVRHNFILYYTVTRLYMPQIGLTPPENFSLLLRPCHLCSTRV